MNDKEIQRELCAMDCTAKIIQTISEYNIKDEDYDFIMCEIKKFADDVISRKENTL